MDTRSSHRTLAELRRGARGVHPLALGHDGLAGALAALPDTWPQVSVDVDGLDDADLDDAARTTAYLLAAESVVNAHKHGASPVAVTARTDGAELVLSVRDNGEGGAHLEPGGGLAGLADRAAALGGAVRMDSPAGGPTVITLVLPSGRGES